MRPRTGEFLAWASIPMFNPHGDVQHEIRPNRPLTDCLAPGSVFSVVTLVAALNEGVVTLEDRLQFEEGRFFYADQTLHDNQVHQGVKLTLREGFAKASSIALAKTGLKLGPTRFYHYITNFGFGQLTGVALVPGETAGWAPPPEQWDRMTPARLWIGLGLSVSQVQMTMAMGAIANSGHLMTPLMISRIESPSGQVLANFQPQVRRAVISPETARSMTAALRAVVSPEGTGQRAALDDYAVAGKTGTAQKSDELGYRSDRYTFIGFFPADSPEVLISVVIEEPQGARAGGFVAAREP
jgi:cell division protein FtsI (penicillin-binding protein 3)